MGSSQNGEIELGGGRSSGSGGSRKGKKISMDRPKQPQRGLGVAQLEKIRIQSQIMSTHTQQSVYPSLFSNNLAMVGYGESRGEDISFGDTQFSVSSRLYPNNRSSSVSESRHLEPVTLPLMEDFVQKRNRHDRSYFTGSNRQVSDSGNSQELDLELKLSI